MTKTISAPGAAVDQPPGHLEAVQARHLDVQEDDVGSRRSICGERLDAVAGLADHLDRAELPEQVAQLVPRGLFVVDDQGSQ